MGNVLRVHKSIYRHCFSLSCLTETERLNTWETYFQNFLFMEFWLSGKSNKSYWKQIKKIDFYLQKYRKKMNSKSNTWAVRQKKKKKEFISTNCTQNHKKTPDKLTYAGTCIVINLEINFYSLVNCLNRLFGILCGLCVNFNILCKRSGQQCCFHMSQ